MIYTSFKRSFFSPFLLLLLLRGDLGLDELLAQYEVAAGQQGEFLSQKESEYQLLDTEVETVEKIREALPPPEPENCPNYSSLEASRR